MPKKTYTLHSTKAFLDLGEAVVRAAAELKAKEKTSKTRGERLPTAVIPLCSDPDDPLFCTKPPWPPGPFGIEINLVRLAKAGKGGKTPRPRPPRK